MKSPSPGQHGRSDAERDHVGQRIEFLAEIAAGAGHAGDAAIESVEQHGKTDRFRGVVEVPILGERWRASPREWRNNRAPCSRS